MSLWAKIFSREYRQARALEAAGKLKEAAQAYARVGREEDLVRIHRLQAGRTEDPAERAHHLRCALVLAEAHAAEDEALLRELRLDLARALATRGPAHLEEAARLFEQGGDFLAAADALLALGRFDLARRALTAGRHFERLEDVDRREAERESALHRARAALAEVDADLSAGRRARALDALLRLKGQARMDPEMRRHVENLLADLEARRPRGRIALSLASARDALTVAADLPVRIGRAEDSILPLRDPGVSRHHARISVEAGRFVLEDLGSRNGTFVDGLLLGAPLTVEGALRIGLGERCEIEVAPLGVTGLLLRVEKGLSAGALALLLAGPVDLAELEGLDLDARLAERSGWFVLTPSGPARLEGRELPAGTSIEVLVDDRITVGEALFEVRRG